MMVAALVAAGLDLAQIGVARRYYVLNLSAYYGGTSTSDWDFQLTLITWFGVAAAICGALAGRLVAGTPRRWYLSLPLAVAAAAGTLAGTPVLLPAASAATGVDEPVTGGRGAIVTAAVLGAVAAGIALAAGRPAWRALICWLGWVWCATALSAWWRFDNAIYGTDVYPLGSLRYPSYTRPDWHLAVDAAAVTLLCGLLAWRSARRGERWAVAAAVSGPVLIITVYLLGKPSQNQDYPAPDHIVGWFLLLLVGCLAAAGSAWLTRRYRVTGQAGGALEAAWSGW